MGKKMTYYAYRRKVYETALLEALGRLHGEILNDGTDPNDAHTAELAKKFCDAFYKDELKLDSSSVADIKSRLSEASEFIRDISDTCENIANDKAEAVKLGEISPEEDETIALSDEDKAVMDQIFDIKKPTDDIEAIRDATVAALIAEDEKAQEVKNSLDIAQSQVAAGENPNALEETISRINAVGPTSLMNSIMNHFSTLAVQDINENGQFTSVADAMSQNKDVIKTRSVMMYTLFEMANRFGIHHYSPAEIERLAAELYYGR